MLLPINLHQWIDENRHLLKPPVGNKQVYHKTKDFIVMVVGGPNARRDFHINGTEELFYQLEGEITIKTIEDDIQRDIQLKVGEMFLLPAKIPHSPRRGAGTIGLVIEKVRDPSEFDAFQWYCEKCGTLLNETHIKVSDIVGQLPLVMEAFYNDTSKTTCQNCGHHNIKP